MKNRCLVNNNLTLILSLTENTVLFENSIPLCFRKQKNIVHDPYGLLCGTFMVSLCKFPSLSITFHVLKCVGHSVCRVLHFLKAKTAWFVLKSIAFFELRFGIYFEVWKEHVQISQLISFNHPEVNGFFWLHVLLYFNQIRKEHVQIVYPIYSCFSRLFSSIPPPPQLLTIRWLLPAKEVWGVLWVWVISQLNPSLNMPILYPTWFTVSTWELVKCLKWSPWLIQDQDIFMFCYLKKYYFKKKLLRFLVSSKS